MFVFLQQLGGYRGTPLYPVMVILGFLAIVFLTVGPCVLSYLLFRYHQKKYADDASKKVYVHAASQVAFIGAVWVLSEFIFNLEPAFFTIFALATVPFALATIVESVRLNIQSNKKIRLWEPVLRAVCIVLLLASLTAFISVSAIYFGLEIPGSSWLTVFQID